LALCRKTETDKQVNVTGDYYKMIRRSAARALKFSRPDEIAAVFCASKKSLAPGAPMAALIFGAHPGLGLILLPIMIYHPLPLIVCSITAEAYSSKRDAAPKDAGLVSAR